MQQGAESEPVQAYLSEFLSLAEFLSKMGTLLLASLGGKGKNGNSLAHPRLPFNTQPSHPAVDTQDS